MPYTQGVRSLAYGAPVNWDAPLNRGLQNWWKVLPGRIGAPTWLDLTVRIALPLTGMSPPSTTQGFGATRRPGGLGELRFNGSTSLGNLGNSSLYASSSDTAHTFACWFLQSSSVAEDEMRIVTWCRAAGSTGWGLYTDTYNANPNRLAGLYKTTANALSACYSTTTIALNTWYFGTWVISGTTGTLYLNAHQEGTVSDVDPSVSFTSGAFASELGHLNGSATTYWPGALDEVRLYNRALSAAEVAALYLASLQGWPQELAWQLWPPLGLRTETPPQRVWSLTQAIQRAVNW